MPSLNSQLLAAKVVRETLIQAQDSACVGLLSATRCSLRQPARLLGDFKKNDIFIEIQFGNSATIYRDYYKFHYGLTHGLLSFAVLVVPTKPREFFPTRPSSVSNMAEYDFAHRCFKLLPIPVPILLIGLLPKN